MNNNINNAYEPVPRKKISLSEIRKKIRTKKQIINFFQEKGNYFSFNF